LSPKRRLPPEDEATGARPFGHLYQPPYKDKKTGERKVSSFWWLKYNDQHGKTRYENTKKRKKPEAEIVRKHRAAEVWAGLLPAKRRETTVGEVLSAWVVYFRLKGRREVDRAEMHTKRLAKFFGADSPAATVTETRIAEYVLSRKNAGRANATINRELACLRAAFRRASRSLDEQGLPLVARVPAVELLEEAAPRAGFFEEWELKAVLGHLSAHVRPVVEFLYLTGYRKSEALELTWDRIDWEQGVVQLAPGTTKSKAGRDPFPFAADPRLERLLRAQRATADAIDPSPSTVFFRRGGGPIMDFRAAWTNACEKAGVNRLVHDLRRTAVRDLILAGVDPKRARRLTGHKTESVFQRYNIVDPRDLVQSVEQVARFVGEGQRLDVVPHLDQDLITVAIGSTTKRNLSPRIWPSRTADRDPCAAHIHFLDGHSAGKGKQRLPLLHDAFLPQRASAACRAIALRCALVSLRWRAFTPIAEIALRSSSVRAAALAYPALLVRSAIESLRRTRLGIGLEYKASTCSLARQKKELDMQVSTAYIDSNMASDHNPTVTEKAGRKPGNAAYKLIASRQ
jgi:integrase